MTHTLGHSAFDAEPALPPCAERDEHPLHRPRYAHPSTRRLVQAATSLLVLVGQLLAISPAGAQQLRVLARPSFHAMRTEAHPAGAKITGTLRDEGQQPITGRPVHLEAAGVTITECATGKQHATTDERGRFCFLLRGSLPAQASLHHPGEGYVSDSSRTVELELTPPELSLALEVDTATWELAGPARQVRVALTAPEASDVYAVTLAIQRGPDAPRQVLPSSSVSAQSPAQFSIEPARLGAPGPATLIATLGDEPGQPLARATMPIVLSAQAELSWPQPLPEVRPELGFELEFGVRAGAGLVNSGRIETRVGEQVVGSAPVSNGMARVESRFIAARQRSVLLSARYIPEHPWLSPGPELQQELRIAGVPWWLHAPWLLCGVLAAVWIFRAWRRPARAAKDRSTASAGTLAVEGVTVLEPQPAEAGWRGTVRDLHTGENIPHARVRITQPAVNAEFTLVETRTDESGQFALPATPQLVEGASWVIEASEHTTLRRPVPPAGRLVVSMTSRRRSLLQLLVRWADTRGWSKDPTPGQLIGAARHRGRPDVEHWARQVEHAVFGTATPDAPQEQALTQAAPPQDQPSALER